MLDATRYRALLFVRDGHCRRVYKRYGNHFKPVAGGPAAKVLWQLARDRLIANAEHTADMLTGDTETVVILTPTGAQALAILELTNAAS